MQKSSLGPKLPERLDEIFERVAKASKAILGDAVVVMFGSAASGEVTATSDIDILVVSEKVPSKAMPRAELKGAIEEEALLPAINPVEIHLATKEEARTNPIYREALKRATTPTRTHGFS